MATIRNLKKLEKLCRTDIEAGHQFLTDAKPEFIDFLCHFLHSHKKYAGDDIKKHIKKILKSDTVSNAKKQMLKSNLETGGSFFSFVKNAGTSLVNTAKNVGSQIADTTGSWFDKTKELASKGLNIAKPYIKEYGPELLGKAAEMIPIVGPVAGPIVKKGSSWLLNKWI